MPPAEIADRFTILALKAAHGINVDVELRDYLTALLAECAAYSKTPGLPTAILDLFFVNAAIWQLEAALKAGRESELSFEELGRRAVEIRNLNARRIHLKNQIASLTDTGYIERKVLHLSEPQ